MSIAKNLPNSTPFHQGTLCLRGNISKKSRGGIPKLWLMSFCSLMEAIWWPEMIAALRCSSKLYFVANSSKGHWFFWVLPQVDWTIVLVRCLCRQEIYRCPKICGHKPGRTKDQRHFQVLIAWMDSVRHWLSFEEGQLTSCFSKNEITIALKRPG